MSRMLAWTDDTFLKYITPIIVRQPPAEAKATSAN